MKVSDEITGDCVGNRKTFSFSSNWTIASGSFDDSVNFESSESPIDADGVDSADKAPLVLKPSESDSSPCEITLSLTQKHEIRQVYVRSTARTYEIYYKPDVHSSNEYLCTVRCSTASREDDSLHESNHGEGSTEPTKESDRDYKEKKSPSSANEDGWVEVKKPESPVEVIKSMPKAIFGDERNLQDFYEATAEISDGEPSVTLIIRLLSLENKGLVYVDEIYVYADAVESADLDNYAAQNLQGGALAGSSLMTMFLPTLLQLTRSNVGQSQNGLNSRKVVEEESAERSRNIDSTNYSNEHYKRSKVLDRQDAEFQEVTEVTAQATPQFKNLAPNVENPGQYHSVVDCNNHVGRVMEQLNSRMSQIEDICLRFEEKMVRPISSMEERLQRLENQLETIVKNTQTSELHSCARFSAPAFSSLDSTSSSFYNDGCANPPHVQSEVEKHEPSCDDISKSTEENFKSGRAPQFIPSYVVTAPEFLCDEDDEQNDAVAPLKDSPGELPKKPMSIDDALAAALAGFSSLTISEPQKLSEKFTKSPNEEIGINEDSLDRPLEESIHRASNFHRDLLMKNPCTMNVDVEFINEETAGEEHLKYTQGLKFTAPDFASEDTICDVKVLTPGIEDVNLVHPSRTFATDGGENILDITSAPSNLSALEKEETSIVRKTNVSEQFCEGQTDADTFGGANNSVSVRSQGGYPATEETSDLSALKREETTIVCKTNVSEQFCEGQSDAYTVGGANNSVSVRAEGDYPDTEETSLQESSSRKDELPIWERLAILQQVHEKNNATVGTKGKKCDERDEFVKHILAQKNFVKHLLAKTKNSVGTAEKNSGPISICERVELVKQLLAKTEDTAEKISGPLLECSEGGSGNGFSLGSVKDDYWATGEIGMLESSSSNILDRIKIIEQLGAKIKDGVGSKEKNLSPTSECDERGSGNDISSWLDFETPILEVKFTSQENTSSELSLKALLTNTEADSQISFTQKSKDDEITTKENDLGSVVIEEGNPTWESNNFLLVDLESYDAPVSSEDVAGHQVPLDIKEHEVLPSLI
ncbi:hypothetical protein DCAR_0934191 [Daucus carota subsp. sativus]|uniref:Uncharacterized protein n=1 Tax=Daucus carota subsp. sativus TaxID=79200 RepID=A0A175YEY2_DAUCS|nr:PREDICTED: uncharacterized protein LOC108202703 [Daucus carota subsp. sativus]WOH14671.1 hypothetical protein DCAR_0934191 [Daucus carota subsp. sativus]